MLPQRLRAAAGGQHGVPVLLLLLSTIAGLAVAAKQKEHRELIGWEEGETYSELHKQKGASGANRTDRWVETIAWKPRAFVHHNFLTAAECDYLVELGTKRVTRSLVVDSATGASKLDDIRTSYGGAFGRGEDPTIASIQERIAEWTHLPPEYSEPMQILRYQDNQKYDAHWDWFNDPVHQRQHLQDGNRYATVLMYLSEPEEGGETTLPLAVAIDEQAQVLDNPSECAARMGIAVKPHKGDALLFFDMDVAGQNGDRRALHASCPTLKGTKWTMTSWIHQKPYAGGFNALEAAAKCYDVAKDCKEKESRGLCDTDPALTGSTGTCRRTCQDCIQCPANDIICYRGNMKGRRASALQRAGRTTGADGAPA